MKKKHPDQFDAYSTATGKYGNRKIPKRPKQAAMKQYLDWFQEDWLSAVPFDMPIMGLQSA